MNVGCAEKGVYWTAARVEALGLALRKHTGKAGGGKGIDGSGEMSGLGKGHHF